MLNGQVLLQQFLRLKLAGDLIGGTGKQAMDSARQALADGQNVEIAGYCMAPALAQGWPGRGSQPPPNAVPGRLVRPEPSRGPARLSAAADSIAAALAGGRPSVRRHKVVGPSFWQTTEIEVCPDLIESSIAALGSSTTARATRPLPA